MSHYPADFRSSESENFYQSGDLPGDFDLEQVNQFQPEIEPRSTTTVASDRYAAAQSESHRYHDQGDPDEYGPRFQTQ